MYIVIIKTCDCSNIKVKNGDTKSYIYYKAQYKVIHKNCDNDSIRMEKLWIFKIFFSKLSILYYLYKS